MYPVFPVLNMLVHPVKKKDGYGKVSDGDITLPYIGRRRQRSYIFGAVSVISEVESRPQLRSLFAHNCASR